MTPIADAAAITRSAKLISAHTGAATLHLSYDGTLPPTEVLDELRRRGWRDAHPSPPPSAAIDWTRPDEARGLRYSLKPHQAITTASFDGTVDQREAAVAWARSILERSGFLAGGAPEVPAAPVAATPTQTPTPAAPEAGVSERGFGFEIVAAEGHVGAVRARIDSFGRIIDERSDTVVTEVTYRGNRSEQVEAVVRFFVEVDVDSEHDFLSAISAHRVVAVHRT